MGKADFNFTKTAILKGFEIDDKHMALINKNTLKELTKEEVFVFKVILGDNVIAHDRNFIPFNAKAIDDMAKLYPGTTFIKDHHRETDNQIARVYATEVIEDGGTNELGESVKILVAYCYMLNNEKNKDLIMEIEAGIKKEVSTSTLPERLICSICGKDNMKEPCLHWWGETYIKAGKEEVCYFTIDGVKDTYELSFVAVPAQVNAGTLKAKEDFINAQKGIEEKTKETNRHLALEIKNLGAFLFKEREEM